MDLIRYEPRKQPTQSRAKATFEAILDAAARILDDEGFAAANTNRIAEVAGVSIGTLYEYFASKEAIFAELRRRLVRVRFDHSRSAFDRAYRASPEGAIRIMIESQIQGTLQTARGEGRLRRAVPAEVLMDQRVESQATIDELSARLYDRHRRSVRKVHNAASTMLTKTIVELYLSYLRVNHPEELEDPKLLDELTDLMARYLLKD